MLIEEKIVVKPEKNPVKEQCVDKMRNPKTKEMILEKTDEVSLIACLVSGFDPVNVEGNYKSKSSSSISIYFGKVSQTWRFICHQTNKEGDVFALWGYCYGLDYKTQLNDILEHINQRMELGL